MAGIGFELRRIFKKNSIFTTIKGVTFASIVTIGPVILVIATLLVMYFIFNFASLPYGEKELFSSVILYVFIFALLVVSLFESLISRYIADKIFEDRLEKVMPSYYMGLLINTIIGSLIAIPFALRAVIVAKVDFFMIFTAYCMFMSVIYVFFAMTYITAIKEYKKIAFTYLIGMLSAVLIAFIVVNVLRFDLIKGILLGYTGGFFITAIQLHVMITRYYPKGDDSYTIFLTSIKKSKGLILVNFCYVLGLYIHNFVFWVLPGRSIVQDTFYILPSYDMASCLAMFTNITTMVIFVVQVETKFHERYTKFCEYIIGGTKADIDTAKKLMFRTLSQQLLYLFELQFVLTVVIFLLVNIFLPLIGFGGMVMNYYPTLTVAYFVVFIMYSMIIFLYYFDDLKGAKMVTISFLIVTFIGSFVAWYMPMQYHGLGLLFGGFVGFSFAFYRIKYIEKNIEKHIFCKGSLIKSKKDHRPSSVVYTNK